MPTKHALPGIVYFVERRFKGVVLQPLVRIHCFGHAEILIVVVCKRGAAAASNQEGCSELVYERQRCCSGGGEREAMLRVDLL